MLAQDARHQEDLSSSRNETQYTFLSEKEGQDHRTDNTTKASSEEENWNSSSTELEAKAPAVPEKQQTSVEAAVDPNSSTLSGVQPDKSTIKDSPGMSEPQPTSPVQTRPRRSSIIPHMYSSQARKQTDRVMLYSSS